MERGFVCEIGRLRLRGWKVSDAYGQKVWGLKNFMNVIYVSPQYWTCSFHFKYFLSTVFAMRLSQCSLNVVVISKIMEMKYDAPQKIIFILQAHPPKGVQKNILKFYGILLKIKSATDALIISHRKVLRTATNGYF